MKKIAIALLALSSCSMLFASIHVKSPLTIIVEGEPGERFSESVVVSNSDTSASTLDLTLSDYKPLLKSSEFPSGGSMLRSNYNWIDLQVDNYEIPSLATAFLPLTINIPSDAKPGSYWSALRVSKQMFNLKENSVTQRIGYLIQVITRVLPRKEANIELSSTNLIKRDDQVLYKAIVRNVSESDVRLIGKIEIYDEEANLISSVQNERKRVYPEAESEYEFDISTVPYGKYVTVITFEGDDTEENFIAQRTLDFGELDEK